MTARLTRDDVAKVALLGRLKLSDDELEQMTTQLGRVLEYVDILNEVDTEGVEPLAHPIELANVFRDDVERESLPREEALANAPKTDGRFFVVPAILDGTSN
ncbi:MAG TPA: Asp-tRNA(Asn)/Glu-tRNA(Gln) amidotransferase subunit GatC [Planctomycetaceae bacterium]|jgi:aspartyl-tRNA(Asn)/glutamyl-tRNA(Gln) amidotransferase subunit C|nr:Asp-tRNA(Asn)/Glu-tRNA(Gln) amidotransferase subunit GatC [Planctomycetaceae bacterium]